MSSSPPSSTSTSTSSEDEFNAETDMAGVPMHQVLKQKFLEGGAGWMAPILLCLVLGLAIVIERVIYLNRATINTNKLLNEVEEALRTGGIEKAKDVCRNTRGPVASIFYQGLDHYEEGMEAVERNVSSEKRIRTQNKSPPFSSFVKIYENDGYFIPLSKFICFWEHRKG